MTERIECVVVGAGAVGLAVARRLAMAGREVIVVEAEASIGNGTSSRNSEVIHAGIYYQPGSLKAQFCVAGKLALYDYCASHGVAHQRLGKLIVANSEAETATLRELRQRAEANGVDDLEALDGAEAVAMEPELRCVSALLSPSTGIIDSHGLMLAYQGDAEAHGAAIAFRTRVAGGIAEDRGIRLRLVDTAGEAEDYRCDFVINSAGHGALDLAKAIQGMPADHVPPGHLLKGNYFTLAGRSPFRRLIYPVPVPGGLGAHITIDLGGQARFGPDTEPVDCLDYSVDPGRAESFYATVRRYWPGLRDGALQPGYAGIRPRLGPLGAGWDFVVQGPETHGVPGLINLFGIESPGLTASLAIADAVHNLTLGAAAPRPIPVDPEEMPKAAPVL